jgi:hypothetical protein
MRLPFVFIPAVFGITILVGLLIGYYMKARNQERLRMIDKGINPDGEMSISEYQKQNNLKNGILLLSLGIGLLIAHILVISIDEFDNFLTYVTMLLISGGIGFLINYSIIKRSGKN